MKMGSRPERRVECADGVVLKIAAWIAHGVGDGHLSRQMVEAVGRARRLSQGSGIAHIALHQG